VTRPGPRSACARFRSLARSFWCSVHRACGTCGIWAKPFGLTVIRFSMRAKAELAQRCGRHRGPVETGRSFTQQQATRRRYYFGFARIGYFGMRFARAWACRSSSFNFAAEALRWSRPTTCCSRISRSWAAVERLQDRSARAGAKFSLCEQSRIKAAPPVTLAFPAAAQPEPTPLPTELDRVTT